MNMQQLLAQAQKAQRELNKAQQALQEKEFGASANGGVTIKMNGKREILDLQIDPDLLDSSSKDMLQDMIKVALNNVLSQIEKESDAINEKVTGGMRF